MKRARDPVRNLLLDSLSAGDRDLVAEDLRAFTLERGDVLFEPGQDAVNIYFPGPGTIAALLLDLREGATVEATMIGYEGAIGGIISDGGKPAFTRGVVQMSGSAMRLAIGVLTSAQQRSTTLRDHFARYADCLLAEVLQSVACNRAHDFDARLARWLLTLHDRIGHADLSITQGFIAEMLGVQRTYATRVIGNLVERGAIEKGRGKIIIKDRRKLERAACECYARLRQHYDRVLPGVYPRPRALT
jgi:CRP-like cAMP-binding protein